VCTAYLTGRGVYTQVDVFDTPPCKIHTVCVRRVLHGGVSTHTTLPPETPYVQSAYLAGRGVDMHAALPVRYVRHLYTQRVDPVGQAPSFVSIHSHC
jgi:hypothetical protein